MPDSVDAASAMAEGAAASGWASILEILQLQTVQSCLLLLLFFGLAWIVRRQGTTRLRRWAEATPTKVDDILVDHLPTALAWSLALAGLWFGLHPLMPEGSAPDHILLGALESVLIVVWARTSLLVASACSASWLPRAIVPAQASCSGAPCPSSTSP